MIWSVPMILHCPTCHMQHVDEVDERTNPGWENPPHMSHKCLGCGTVWRPCNQYTEGVRILDRHGKTDTWPAIGRRDCKQPPRVDGQPRNCAEDYCLCKVFDDARDRCIAKGEGWRWGL